MTTTRVQEVEAVIVESYRSSYLPPLENFARTLAAEVDELRGKLDDVRMGIGCARGQRTTQYCADLAQRDEVITNLLEMLKPEKHRPSWEHEAYARALEIAGRTE